MTFYEKKDLEERLKIGAAKALSDARLYESYANYYKQLAINCRGQVNLLEEAVFEMWRLTTDDEEGLI